MQASEDGSLVCKTGLAEMMAAMPELADSAAPKCVFPLFFSFILFQDMRSTGQLAAVAGVAAGNPVLFARILLPLPFPLPCSANVVLSPDNT